MLRIFSELTLMTVAEDEDYQNFEKAALNVDNITAIEPWDVETTWIRMTDQNVYSIGLPIDEVIKIVCGNKI